jgi:hypothetical protein
MSAYKDVNRLKLFDLLENFMFKLINLKKVSEKGYEKTKVRTHTIAQKKFCHASKIGKI